MPDTQPAPLKKKLEMTYERTVTVPFDVLYPCTPSHEVHSRGEGIYTHKPLRNQGRFGNQDSSRQTESGLVQV